METVRELGAATARPPVAVDGFIERFRAHARGVWRGRPGGRRPSRRSPARAPAGDSQQLSRLLAGRLPDFEGELFGPLEAAIHPAGQRRRRRPRRGAGCGAEFEALVRQARLERPVGDLAVAVAALVTVG